MKSFYTVVLVVGVLCTITLAAITPEKRHEIEKKTFEECKGPTHATDDDVNSLLEHEVPVTRSGKCLLACAQEKFEIIVDGELSNEGFKALGAQKYEGNEKAIATFNELVEDCKTITDSDKCELSAKLMACMKNAAEKRGIDPIKGIQS